MPNVNDPTPLRPKPVDESSQTDEDSLIGRKEKPREPPKSKEDFKEVLEERGKKKKSSITQPLAMEGTDKPATSIFDLSGQKVQTPGFPKKGNKLAALEKALEKGFKPSASAEALPRNAFAAAQADLSEVNPLPGRREEVSTIKEIVRQVVDKVIVMKAGGQTDTVITLKHPPLLEGASIKLSAFKSARGEFNIAFTNLTQEAKNILDTNQNALLHALDARGFTVHIFTTSTVETPTIISEAESTERGEREGRREGEREGQRGQEG